MADYIYTMEIRLTPDQLKRRQSGAGSSPRGGHHPLPNRRCNPRHYQRFTIRDLDFTVQGNPLKLQKDFERAGAQLAGHDDDVRTLFLVLPGNVRAEVGMARTETYEKVGKPPTIAAASIQEDLRRRDFTVNAMALSLNEGSRGLLLDPLMASPISRQKFFGSCTTIRSLRILALNSRHPLCRPLPLASGGTHPAALRLGPGK